MPDVRGGKHVPGALWRLVNDLPWGAESAPPPSTRIEISGDRKVDARLRIERIGKTRKDAERELGKILPKEAVQELLGGEARLFKWLDKDPSHPTVLALDPLEALRQAGVELSDRASAALRGHRGAAKRSAAPAEAKNLASLRIEVVRDEEKAK
jgi:hypothetical protein